MLAVCRSDLIVVAVTCVSGVVSIENACNNALRVLRACSREDVSRLFAGEVLESLSKNMCQWFSCFSVLVAFLCAFFNFLYNSAFFFIFWLPSVLCLRSMPMSFMCLMLGLCLHKLFGLLHYSPVLYYECINYKCILFEPSKLTVLVIIWWGPSLFAPSVFVAGESLLRGRETSGGENVSVSRQPARGVMAEFSGHVADQVWACSVRHDQTGQWKSRSVPSTVCAHSVHMYCAYTQCTCTMFTHCAHVLCVHSVHMYCVYTQHALVLCMHSTIFFNLEWGFWHLNWFSFWPDVKRQKVVTLI